MLFREEDEDLEVLPFEDRAEAGRILASKLAAYSGRWDVIVLGLPCGGVPVASAVAAALHVPLDVFVVSKLGTPWEQELAMGALAEGSVEVLDLSLVTVQGVSEQDIQDVVAAGQKELESRERLYRHGRPPLDVEGKTVILWTMASRRVAAFWPQLQRSAGETSHELWLRYLSPRLRDAVRSGCKPMKSLAWKSRKCSWRCLSGTGTSSRSATRTCNGCWRVGAQCRVPLECHTIQLQEEKK